MTAFMFFTDCFLPYISFPVLVIGTIWRLWTWFRIPLPLRVGLAPVPTTQRGVIGRIVIEVLLFRTFFLSERAFWFIIWPFHLIGLIILWGHLTGFADGLRKVYAPHLTIPWYEIIYFIAAPAALLWIALLLWIFIRRLYKVEIRRMSYFSDYVALLLIFGVILTGTYMRYFVEVDKDAIIRMFLGLMTFKPVSVGSWIFSLHFLFAQVLFIYFPFSKLFHPLGQIASRMITQKEKLLHPEGVVVK